MHEVRKFVQEVVFENAAKFVPFFLLQCDKSLLNSVISVTMYIQSSDSI